jgi:hypothetical protein
MIGGLKEDARLTADEVDSRVREDYERTHTATSYPRSTEDGNDVRTPDGTRSVDRSPDDVVRLAVDQRVDPAEGYDEGGQLFPSKELTDLRARWDKAQISFVDEPRTAVKQADELVATVVKRISEQFASERSELEHQWDRGDNVSTEDLRLALRRYRTFFDRLLAF